MKAFLQRLLFILVFGVLSVGVTLGDTYSKVTSLTQLVPGASYLLVYETADAQSNPIAYANTSTCSEGQLSITSSVSITDNNIPLPAGAAPLTLGTSGSYWTFDFGEENYLSMVTIVNPCTLNIYGPTILEASKWNINFTNESVVIQNIEVINSCIYKLRNFNGTFQVKYGTGGTSNFPVALYKKDEAISSMVQNNGEGDYWATFSEVAHNTFFPNDNATVYIVERNGAQLSLVPVPTQTISSVTGYVVPANTGVVVRSSNPTVSYSTTSVAFTGEVGFFSSNLLHATDGNLITGVENHVYYKLACQSYNGTTGECTNLGFYYGAANGAAYTPGLGKAYLDWDNTPNGAPSRLTLDEMLEGEDITTSANRVKQASAAVKFIENGQLHILHEGVVYDIMGKPIK